MVIYPVSEIANTTCILNGASVHAEAARPLIARISSELGTQAQVNVTRAGDELVPLAKRAVSEKHARVAAGGGDGTVNAVAGVVAGTDTALGPFRGDCSDADRNAFSVLGSYAASSLIDAWRDGLSS